MQGETNAEITATIFTCRQIMVLFSQINRAIMGLRDASHFIDFDVFFFVFYFIIILKWHIDEVTDSTAFLHFLFEPLIFIQQSDKIHKRSD